MKKKAFAVVGHSNWGKSYTLRSLTNDTIQYRWWKIKGELFNIKRMSNDDDTEGLLDFVKGIDHNEHLIFALCPEFENLDRKTKDILNVLKKKFELYFWVNKKAYVGGGVISDTEIAELKKFGTIEIYDSKSESHTRASSLQRFIKNNL